MPSVFHNNIGFKSYILRDNHIWETSWRFKAQKAEEVITYLSSPSEYKLCSADMIAEVMLGVLLFKFSRNHNRDFKVFLM